MHDPIQDAVNKGPGIVRAITLSEIDRFIKGGFRGDVIAVEELKNGHPENGPVNRCNPLEAPMLRVLFNELTHLLEVFENTLHDPLKKSAILSLQRKVFSEMGRANRSILPAELPLIKDLKGRLS